MTNILIAAPTPMMRAGLRAMLAGGEIEVVGEAATLADLPEDRARVDVLVVADDDLLEERAADLPGDWTPAIVVLSDEAWPADALARMPLRGWGLVPVESTAEELRAAVLAAAQGLIVLSPPLSRQLLAGRDATPVARHDALVETLTPRELEVLQLLSDGLSNKQIARRLQISEHTVKFHVSSIYTKLGAVSRADAVSRGARHGLITL